MPVGLAGYKVNDVKSMKSGLKASLSMAGEGCNAFGVDIQDLTLEVRLASDPSYVGGG